MAFSNGNSKKERKSSNNADRVGEVDLRKGTKPCNSAEICQDFEKK